jgi:hypothetical protein
MAKTFNEAEIAQAKQALECAFKTLKVSHKFQPGQFVRWKKDMKNRRRPAYGEPVIVAEVLQTAVFDKEAGEEAGTPLFREPLDLVIGLFAEEDGGFLLYHLDSRRLESFPQ